jgi:hypothetical protein
MNTIYSDTTYSITQEGNRAILKNGVQKISFPFCSPAAEIPKKYLASLRKAGKDPAEYFFVGTSQDGTLLRRAALPAWEAALADAQAEKRRETEQKETEKQVQIQQGKKGLLFYGNCISAALVRVRPATPDEGKKFAQWYREGLYIELDRQPLQFEVADRFCMEWRLPETQRSGKWTQEQDSSLFLLTDEQWETLVQAEKEFHAAQIAAHQQKIVAEANRLEAARREAAQKGEPVELEQFTTSCDGRVTDCTFDIIRIFMMADGSTYTQRTHCH